MIGILGGTFDPVHHGHLRLALEMCDRLALDQVRLVPAKAPPHREPPRASAADRTAMLNAAIDGEASLVVDTRELEREGASYSVDTLADVRAEFPDVPLCFIMGMDAFCELHTWHRWERLLELTHIGIARRPGSAEPTGPVARLLEQRRVHDPGLLRQRPAGGVNIQDMPLLEISATGIRGMIGRCANPRYLLPDDVLTLIRGRGLYIDDT